MSTALSQIIVLTIVLPLILFLLSAITGTIIPDSFGSAIASTFGYLKHFDFIFPITTLVTLLGLTLTFQSLLLVFRTGFWVIRLVRS